MNVTDQKHFFDVLGIPIGSDEETIRKAYRTKAFEYHPDRNHDKNAEKIFIEVSEAYRMLSNHPAFKITDRKVHLDNGDIVPFQNCELSFEDGEMMFRYGHSWESFRYDEGPPYDFKIPLKIVMGYIIEERAEKLPQEQRQTNYSIADLILGRKRPDNLSKEDFEIVVKNARRFLSGLVDIRETEDGGLFMGFFDWDDPLGDTSIFGCEIYDETILLSKTEYDIIMMYSGIFLGTDLNALKELSSINS